MVVYQRVWGYTSLVGQFVFFRINRQASTGHHMAGNASGGCFLFKVSCLPTCRKLRIAACLVEYSLQQGVFPRLGAPRWISWVPISSGSPVREWSEFEASSWYLLKISQDFLISWSIDHNSHLILGYQDLFGHVWTSHISKVPGVGCWMLASCCIY